MIIKSLEWSPRGMLEDEFVGHKSMDQIIKRY